MKKQISILFAGDVITPPLARIGAELPEFDLEIAHHDIDQIFQLLAATVDADVVVLHASADFFLDETTAEAARARMSAYCEAVGAFAARTSALVLVNTLETWPDRIVGAKYLDDLILLAALNDQLFGLARRISSVSVIDVGGIVASIGRSHALSLHNRLVMRMPYTKVAASKIASAYAQAIRERHTARKKVIVLDADNTLWGGIVGEDGVDGVAIDRQYPGSVYRRFQMQLRDLSETGLLLALVSKNNPADVEEVFDRREMPLTRAHFSAVKVNWNPKSDNIAAIAEELNLGRDSLIFIDDNPFELEQVRAAFPEVDVYQFDGSRTDQALGLLASIPGLKTWSVTSEDRAKVEQYRQERQRTEAREQAMSLDDYLASLDLQLEIGVNRRSQIKRLSQLTNKTNQFNLTTRRYSESDIDRLMGRGQVFDVRLRDRFGDMGIVGVVIVADGEIDTFLMSCRALGRGVEAQILAWVCSAAGRSDLTASYWPTSKNVMTAQFFDANGFELIGQTENGVKRYRLAEGPQSVRPIPISEVE